MKPTPQNAIGSTGRSAGTVSRQDDNRGDNCPKAERPLPLRSLLTPRVLVAAGNYASVSLLDIAFRAIQPVFLSTPIHLGGLGLSPPSIGSLLSIQGILIGLFQVFFSLGSMIVGVRKKLLLRGSPPQSLYFLCFLLPTLWHELKDIAQQFGQQLEYKLLQGFYLVYPMVSIPFHNLQTVFIF